MTTIAKENVTVNGVPEFLVAVSDFHIGKDSSILHENPQVHEAAQNAIARARHVVYVGDTYELKFLPKQAGKSNEGIVLKAIDNAVADLERQLVEKPERVIHFIPGNHENLELFFDRLKDLQRHHQNFEWHPEAIKIGNALFTHGDLTDRKKTAMQRGLVSVKQASFRVGVESRPEANGEIRPRSSGDTRVSKEAQRTYDALDEWAKRATRAEQGAPFKGAELLSFSENRKRGLLTEAVWATVDHVFFGHTHRPFTHLHMKDEAGGGKARWMHNSGSTTRETVQSPKDLGFIAAELNGGELKNIVSYSRYQSWPEMQRQYENGSAHLLRLLAEGFAPQNGRG